MYESHVTQLYLGGASTEGFFFFVVWAITLSYEMSFCRNVHYFLEDKTHASM
jgi:hypothetical protein